MNVFISLDGTNFSTAPLSLDDLGSITSAPVLATVANRTYAFRAVGAKKIRVQQTGATAVENACLS
jgi:hypothetical protein